MVQLNKHFHLNHCIITAKAIYSLALIYFIEFHKLHFIFYVKNILKGIFCSLDLIETCETVIFCSPVTALSLVLRQRLLPRGGHFAGSRPAPRNRGSGGWRCTWELCSGVRW